MDKVTKSALAVAITAVATLSFGAIALAEAPFFVTSEPADQTVDEGDEATFLYNIDTSRAWELAKNNPGKPLAYYTWLQVESSKISNFNINIPTSCLPYNGLVSENNWLRDGDTYSIDINDSKCHDANPANYRAISVMISEPFTVNGNYFKADQWYDSVAVEGRAVLTFDYETTAESNTQAIVVPYNQIDYAQYLLDGQLLHLTDDAVGGSDIPAILCDTDGLLDFNLCQVLTSGSNWLTIPENGEYAVIIVNDFDYSASSEAKAKISNIRLNNVVAELGDEASLTLSPDDAAYYSGAEFMAFTTIYPGADIPLDWVSRVATLRFNEYSNPGISPPGGIAPLVNVAVPNTGQK